MQGFDGWDAVWLWQQAKLGSTEALDLLVTYNRFDTQNLFDLADIVYDRLRAKTGFDGLSGSRYRQADPD